MKKYASIVIIIILVAGVILGFFLRPGYDKNWIKGKNSAQIEAQYGKFYQCGMPPDSDGLYKNCRCSLIIRGKRVGFFGTVPERVLAITFDANGFASETEITTGNWGG